MRKFLVLLIPFLMAAMPVNPSYVAPDGSGSTCSFASPCALSYANTNADDDDVVNLRGGTYSTGINPSNSGSARHVITYKAYTGETPVISGAELVGIYLGNASYIKITGITVSDVARWALIQNSSHHNEISYCTFTDTDGTMTTGFYLYGYCGSGTDYTCFSTHNWIHHNTISNYGYVSAECNDEGYVMTLGTVITGGSENNNNTIENNTLYSGGHHLIETTGKYNVIRNNFLHNEGFMAKDSDCAKYRREEGKYGNRNIQIYDGYDSDGTFNLVEGNRLGPSGPSPDDDGGDGMTITAPKNIVRFNSVYNAQNNGVLFKTGANSVADNNRFYNNTIFSSGRYDNHYDTGTWYGANFRWYGTYARTGNILKNNILYSYGTGGADWTGGDVDIYTNNTVTNNHCTDAAAGKCVSSGDPKFIDSTLPAITGTQTTTQPNLKLQSGSGAIKTGASLTLANGAGAGSTSLTVDDALYFQAGSAAATTPIGSSLSSIAGDYILINGQVRQITDINYATNVLTLDSAASWADNAPVYLYKKSDGVQVSYGGVMDIGAEPFTGNASVGTGAGFTLGTGAAISVQ
jgi:hypothetical protein